MSEEEEEEKERECEASNSRDEVRLFKLEHWALPNGA